MISKLGSPLRRERFLSLNRGDRSSPMEERRPVRHLVLRGSTRFEEMRQHGGGRSARRSSASTWNSRWKWKICRAICRHCVAGNVKPCQAYAYSCGRDGEKLRLRVTHGTRLGNERDKHVSVTGPPVEGPERRAERVWCPVLPAPSALILRGPMRYRACFRDIFPSPLPSRSA